MPINIHAYMHFFFLAQQFFKAEVSHQRPIYSYVIDKTGAALIEAWKLQKALPTLPLPLRARKPLWEPILTESLDNPLP